MFPVQLTGVGFALLGMLAWGAWALFVKIALRSASPEAVLLASYLTATLLIGGYVAVTPTDLAPTSTGLLFSVAGGLFAGLGSIAYYLSLRQTEVGVTTTITAMYFVVAAILGVVVLRETMTATEALGTLLAAAGVVLIAQ